MLLIGHNCRVEGTNVVIQRVRTATSRGFPPRFGDPFTGYTWADGQVHPLRTFVWGRNLKKAKCGRKYTRTARKNAELRSYDPARKQTLVARHPPLKQGSTSGPQTSSKRAVSALPGDGGQVTKYCVYEVSGITDLNTLQIAAQHYYEGLNRGELEFTGTTRNVASYGGDNADPDVLDMLPGDRIEYLVDAQAGGEDQAAATIGVLEDAAMQQTLARQNLQALGFGDDFIDAYLTANSNT